MKLKKLYLAVACTLCVGVAASPESFADTVTLYDGVGFMTGQQSLQDTFSVSGPGTLSVTLKDFAWPIAFNTLDAMVSTPSGMLGPEFGAGTSIFNIAGPTTVTAQWFGTAAGTMDAGLYGLTMQFTPAGSAASAVPLPASIALLLSGLGLVAWQRRSRPLPLAA